MSLVALGASYKSAPIASRERLAVSTGDLFAALASLAAREGVNEAVVLSTCNRVEAYVDAKTDRLGADALIAFFEERTGAPLVRDELYLERGLDTVRHLFRVVCSLDSQVLGEAQILGQTKRALEAAQEAGTCSDVLARLFKNAINLGKRVRTETAIGADSVSLSTAAFKAARNAFPDLEQRSVLFVGTGEMAQIALEYVCDAGVKRIAVCSRTLDHARAFVEPCGGSAHAFDERYGLAARADVVFSMTSAPCAVFESEPLQAARIAAGRADSRLVIVDESMPRDVDPTCAQLSGVSVHDQEALSAVVDEGLAVRLSALGEVERLAAEAEASFLEWMQERSVAPTIKEMYEKGALAVQKELARAGKALASSRGQELSDAEREILEAFGESIVKKLLHGPAARLRKEAHAADSYYYTSSARYLFGLDAFPPGTPCPHCAEQTCKTTGTCAHRGTSGAGALPRQRDMLSL